MNVLIVAAAYVFTQVVIPGASSISPWGINDKEQVVVQTDIGSGVYHRGTFTPLPPPPAGLQVLGYGINNAGVVVGSAVAADGNEQGFILTGAAYKFFSRPGWPNTLARATGNSGLITGLSYALDEHGEFGIPSAGFVYDPRTETFTDVTPPGSDGFRIFAQGINKAGVISGSARDSNIGPYAFVWQMDTFASGKPGVTRFIDRIRIAAGFARARGINDAGLITGFSADETDSTGVGFVGNSVHGFHLLTVPGATPENGGTVCQGINNLAQVTCGFNDGVPGNDHAFIGSPEGRGEEN